MSDPLSPTSARLTPWSSIRLTYGITPPKERFDEERRKRTAALQSERIQGLPVDALVVYDLQDESSRTDVERPFPFMRVLDPLTYAYEDLRGVSHPKIIYRPVSSMTEASLVDWMKRLKEHSGAAVFVGAPSHEAKVNLKLGQAYQVRQETQADLPLGGVVIAERHATRGDEDERVQRKALRGCSFFISQAVYSVSESMNFLSDLYYRCQATGTNVPPILVTLSPCGSPQTLRFMSWLGVHVPRWIENELLHSRDILQRSVDLSLSGFSDLLEFAREKDIPLGCNVESVSLRKAEIEASVEMVHRVSAMLNRG